MPGSTSASARAAEPLCVPLGGGKPETVLEYTGNCTKLASCTGYTDYGGYTDYAGYADHTYYTCYTDCASSASAVCRLPMEC